MSKLFLFADAAFSIHIVTEISTAVVLLYTKTARKSITVSPALGWHALSHK